MTVSNCNPRWDLAQKLTQLSHEPTYFFSFVCRKVVLRLQEQAAVSFTTDQKNIIWTTLGKEYLTELRTSYINEYKDIFLQPFADDEIKKMLKHSRVGRIDYYTMNRRLVKKCKQHIPKSFEIARNIDEEALKLSPHVITALAIKGVVLPLFDLSN